MRIIRVLFWSLILIFSSSLSNAQRYTISTIAGNGTWGYSGDGGPATSAELYSPWEVAVDLSGNVYVADRDNNRIRKVDVHGIISTFAGNGAAGYNGDGISATSAEINAPWGVAVDLSGNIYIADYNNRRLRRVDTSGIITTFAGNGNYGYSGDGGLATSAEITEPVSVAVDKFNNVYFSDLDNYRIRKVNTLGVISTIAGNGTQSNSGDGGPAISAGFYWPYGVTIDTSGNVYISDYGVFRVRKVNTSGIISNFAGNGTPGYSGDGGPAISAEFNELGYVYADNSGNVFIVDDGSERVREVNLSGIINTIAGNGIMGFEGDGGPAISAEFNEPEGITIDNLGNIYIADYYNARIRKLTLGQASIDKISNQQNELTLFPNPNNGVFTIGISDKEQGISVMQLEIFNMLGEKIYDATLPQTQNEINLRGKPNGVYLYRVLTEDGSLIGTGKFVIE